MYLVSDISKLPLPYTLLNIVDYKKLSCNPAVVVAPSGRDMYSYMSIYALFDESTVNRVVKMFERGLKPTVAPRNIKVNDDIKLGYPFCIENVVIRSSSYARFYFYLLFDSDSRFANVGYYHTTALNRFYGINTMDEDDIMYETDFIYRESLGFIYAVRTMHSWFG